MTFLLSPLAASVRRTFRSPGSRSFYTGAYEHRRRHHRQGPTRALESGSGRQFPIIGGFHISAEIPETPFLAETAPPPNPHSPPSAHRLPAGSFIGGFPTPAPYPRQPPTPGRHPKPYQFPPFAEPRWSLDCISAIAWRSPAHRRAECGSCRSVARVIGAPRWRLAGEIKSELARRGPLGFALLARRILAIHLVLPAERVRLAAINRQFQPLGRAVGRALDGNSRQVWYRLGVIDLPRLAVQLASGWSTLKRCVSPFSSNTSRPDRAVLLPAGAVAGRGLHPLEKHRLVMAHGGLQSFFAQLAGRRVENQSALPNAFRRRIRTYSRASRRVDQKSRRQFGRCPSCLQ